MLKRYNTDFSVNFWVNMHSYSTASGYIILSNRGYGTPLTSSSPSIEGRGNGTGRYGRPVLSIKGLNFGSWVFADETLVLNQWYMVTMTFNYSPSGYNTGKIYINCKLSNSNTTMDDIIDPGNTPSIIGYENIDVSKDYHFHGVLDEFRIYNRALSEEEVGLLYDKHTTDSILNLGSDTTICHSSTLILDAGNNFKSYLWQDGSTSNIFQVTEGGEYWVEVENDCSILRDTIIVSKPEIIDIFNDSLKICQGDSAYITIPPFIENFVWDNNSKERQRKVLSDGEYWIEVDNGCITYRDTIVVDIEELADIVPDSILMCLGDTAFLTVPSYINNFIWDDNSKERERKILSEGEYWIAINNDCGVYSDRTTVSFIKNKFENTNLLKDTITVCPDEVIELRNPYPTEDFTWQDGSNNPIMHVSSEGLYYLTVNSKCSSFQDSVYVDYLSSLSNKDICNAFSPNNDNINDFFELPEGLAPLSLQIFNRWGKKLFESSDYHNNWDASNLSAGDYFYIINSKKLCKPIKGTVLIIRD